MIDFPRSLHHLAVMAVLPFFALVTPAGAATVRKAGVPAATPKSVAVDNSIIPLPLAPVVPPAQRVCADSTAAGLGYTMLRAGPGAKPAADATALVNYVGYLAASGAVFDQGMSSPLPVGEVILGFSQGLQMLGETGVIRLCIPAAMAYGARESGPIPANSDLVFQVELLDFRTAAEINDMRKARSAEPAAQEDSGSPH